MPLKIESQTIHEYREGVGGCFSEEMFVMKIQYARVCLVVVGILYLFSGAWCLINVDASASFLGFGLTNAEAYAEFASVYGGLQLGFAVAMLSLARYDQHVYSASLFALILSTMFLVIRLYSVHTYLVWDMAPSWYGMVVLELAIVVVLWLGVAKSNPKPVTRAYSRA